MARTKNPRTRALLVERAAQMLARREPVTLRALVAGTEVSTMAVYTYFDGIDGLWRAVRQEGFTRLAAELATVRTGPDPVRDLAALGAGYLANAVANPDLYRAMFDVTAELEDAPAAGATLGLLIAAAARAREAGRFAADTDPEATALRMWVIGHGLASLVATGPLPDAALAHGEPLLTALFVAAGDEPARCSRSVARGWRSRRPG
ncbi:TetR/AcrR family transcriptional regulator [Nocardia jiangsuensis]|uniref:TetR/AcrR family transcriptional regulator n=1 Tax=Nocardia jiangsuensis TaxID=1691563 RepID=A0ABV8DVH9_9NOCA